MTTIGITGANGFLGWHLRCKLRMAGYPTPIEAGRSTMATHTTLQQFVDNCDIVVHVAGVNRAETTLEIGHGNIEPARALAKAVSESASPTSLIYANTRQEPDSGIYGKAKHQAAAIMASAQSARDQPFVNILFPHLFGEYGRPNYNSAVHTFSYQIANNIQRKIHKNIQLELIHAQEAAQIIVDSFKSKSVTIRPSGIEISVTDTLHRLEQLAAPYMHNGSIPNMPSSFELQLFNTFKSQLPDTHLPTELPVHSDNRGNFFEILRSFGPGQTSVSTTKPQVTRGNHFHQSKIERFVVVGGSAVINLRKLFSDKLVSIFVSDDRPVAVDIPTLTTHSITNTGTTDLTTLFWSNDHFNPETPDTYSEVVCSSKDNS